MFKRFKLLGVLLAIVLFAVSGQADAATDWNKRVITVTGMGVANPAMAVNQAHAAMLARQAAITDAYRLLASEVYGVKVDAETTVEQKMLTSDIVKTRVSGVITGARIANEGEIAGGYSVTLELALFGGDSSLAEAVFEHPAYVEPLPVPSPSYEPPVSRPTYGNYTGLIVDCRGLRQGINPVMSPVILNTNGTKIYGHKNLNREKIIRDGMASYARDMSQADRAGSNPLIIKAVALENFNANPVLSVEDADRVLYENSRSHFLEDTAVVFLQ